MIGDFGFLVGKAWRLADEGAVGGELELAADFEVNAEKLKN
jgi:hypothetical protein